MIYMDHTPAIIICGLERLKRRLIPIPYPKPNAIYQQESKPTNKTQI
jgi:hypothetical protein